ncbi:MAG TPA: hypothetical protein VD902_19485, partial [Symbiobacteriaceae bacterium]|nr:hypothetical protein [Symbiobacteriaceae bacterium]
MHDPLLQPGGPKSLGVEPLRLTRALAQDLRASVHGLRMALDMMNGVMSSCKARCVDHFLGMAQTEA